jgi:PhzF family phenazine biosynthesis protein
VGIPLFTVDAFTDRPFSGNPAGVCLLDAPRDADWMQKVAREMNLSETAFLVPRADGFDLRWFTPAVEVDLCGHATLASAHVLWEAGRLGAASAARFQTRSGLLAAERKVGWIEMDFPAKPETPAEAPAGLLEALGAKAVHVGMNQFDYLVEVTGEDVVRALAPDLARLATLPVRGVIVTSRPREAGAGGAACDFVSRFFAPAVGVPEDPVTGSAHCCLAPYWGRKLGKTEMVGRQLSARGGTVRVRVAGDRVMLGGSAVTVMRGELV